MTGAAAKADTYGDYIGFAQQLVFVAALNIQGALHSRVSEGASLDDHVLSHRRRAAGG